MYGFTGTLLRIDLTAGSIQKEILDPVLAKKISGRKRSGYKDLYR